MQKAPEVTRGAAPLFEEFFTEAWPWAFRLASFLTHDTEAGEDIAQEVLTAMSQRWPVADRPAAYLRTSLVNASINWNRRNRTMRDKLPLLAGTDSVDFHVDELADAIAHLPIRPACRARTRRPTRNARRGPPTSPRHLGRRRHRALPLPSFSRNYTLPQPIFEQGKTQLSARRPDGSELAGPTTPLVAACALLQR